MAGFDQNMSADNALINNTSAGLQMGVPNPYSTPVTGEQAPPSNPTVQAFNESRARTQGLMAQVTAPRAQAASPMSGMLGIDPTSSKIFSNGNIYDITDLPSMYKALENGDLEGSKVPPPPGMLMTPASAVKAHLDSIPDWKKEWGSSIRNYGAGFAAIGAAAGSETSLDKFKQLSGDADLLGRHSSAPDQFKDVEFGTNFLPYVRKLGIGSVPYIAEAMVTGFGLGSLFKGGGVAAAKTFAEGAIKKEATNLLANSALRMTEEQALVQAANTVGKSLARSGGMVAGTYPSSVGDILGNQYDQTSQNGGEGRFDLGSAAALGVPYAGLNLAGMEGLASGGRFLGSQAGKSTMKPLARGAVGVGEVLAGESFNETGQEVMNQAGRVAVDPAASMTSDDALNRYKESAIGGAILGAVGGGAHGAHMALSPTALTPTELLQRVSTNESRWDAGVQNNATTSQKNEWQGVTGISEDEQAPPAPPPPAPPAPPSQFTQVETTRYQPTIADGIFLDTKTGSFGPKPELITPNEPVGRKPNAPPPAMGGKPLANPGDDLFDSMPFSAEQGSPVPGGYQGNTGEAAPLNLEPHLSKPVELPGYGANNAPVVNADQGTIYEPGSAEGLRHQLYRQQAEGDVEAIRKAEGELKKGKINKSALARAKQTQLDNKPAAEVDQYAADTPQGWLHGPEGGLFQSPMEDWKARIEKVAKKHSVAGYLIRKALAHDDPATAAKALREEMYKLRPSRAASTSEEAESTVLKKMLALSAAHTVLTGQSIEAFRKDPSEQAKFAHLSEGLSTEERKYFAAAIGQITGVKPDSDIQIANDLGVRQDKISKDAKGTLEHLREIGAVLEMARTPVVKLTDAEAKTMSEAEVKERRAKDQAAQRKQDAEVRAEAAKYRTMFENIRNGTSPLSVLSTEDTAKIENAIEELQAELAKQEGEHTGGATEAARYDDESTGDAAAEPDSDREISLLAQMSLWTNAVLGRRNKQGDSSIPSPAARNAYNAVFDDVVENGFPVADFAAVKKEGRTRVSTLPKDIKKRIDSDEPMTLRPYSELTHAEKMHITESIRSASHQPDQYATEKESEEETVPAEEAVHDAEAADEMAEDAEESLRMAIEAQQYSLKHEDVGAEEVQADIDSMKADLAALVKERKKIEAELKKRKKQEAAKRQKKLDAMTPAERERALIAEEIEKTNATTNPTPQAKVKAETRRAMLIMMASEKPIVETTRREDTPVDVNTELRSEKGRPVVEEADAPDTVESLVAKNLEGKKLKPGLEINNELQLSIEEWDALAMPGEPDWMSLSIKQQVAWVTNFIKWKSDNFIEDVSEPKDMKETSLEGYRRENKLAEERTKPTARSGAGKAESTEGAPATSIQEAFARAKKEVRDNTVPDAVKRLQKQIEEVKNELTRQSQKAAVASAVKTALADNITDQARVYRLVDILDKYTEMRDKEQGRTKKYSTEESFEPVANPLSIASTKAVADQVSKRFPNAPKINIIEVADAPEKDRNKKGWYDTRTGEVTIVADKHDSPAGVVATYFHEVAGHYGLAGAFGTELNKILDDAYTNANVKSMADKAMAKDGISQREAVEEVLAESQVGFKSAFMDRVKAAIAKTMRAIGKLVGKNWYKQLTDAEVKGILRSAKNYATDGTKPPTPTGEGKKFRSASAETLATPTPADFVPTTTFKGRVVDVIGKLQNLGVSFREMAQIEREYKDLPVEPYTKLTHLTGAYAKKIMDRGVNSVLNVWNTFTEAENKQFTDMLNKDTLSQFLSSEDVTHPRNKWIQDAVDNADAKSAEDIAYAEKQAVRFQAQRDAFNHMPKKMQELYREVDSFMQDMAKEEFKNRAGATVDAFLPQIKELATPEQRAAIGKLSYSNEPDMKEFSAYKKAMLAILKGTDPKKVENKKAVDAFREMANEVSDKMEGYHQRKGLYFPLLRFGDHLVIAKSKVFAELEKKVDDLKSEVNEFKKTNPVLQEYAELVATAAEAREAARGRLRSESARTGFKNATNAIKAFKKTVEFKQANRLLLDIRDDLKDAAADLKHKAARQEHYAFHREESQDKANQRVANYKANGMDAITKLRDEWIDGMDTVSTSFSKKLIDKLSAHYQNDPAMQARISGTVRKLFTDTQHDQSALHRMAMRRNVAGFHPDGNRVFQSFLQQSSHRLAAQRYFMQTQDALENVRRAASDNDKSLTAKEKLTAVANELAIRNDMDMQYRETPIQDSIARFTQLMTLGMSPSFLLQQSAQPLMLTLPQLRGRSSSVDAAKALATGMSDAWTILRASAKGSGLMNRFEVKLDHSLLTAGEKQALHEISDLGLIDILLDHDVALGAKGKQMGRYDKFVEMTNWAGRQIEVVNRIGSTLAAYREEIKRGSTQAEATKYAANVVEQSQVDYSNENASRWTKRGAFSGSKVITQFKKYQIHMIQMLVWNAKEAVAGETPAARTEARRILVGMLTTHGVMGGTLGLPFAAPVFGIAKLVSLMWPSDDREDPETAYKNFLADMLGKDLGDVVARGVFASLGIDLSRTLGLGTLFNPVPFVRTDKQGKDLLNEMVLGLLGPSVSVGQRTADGASKLANGDLLGAWIGMAPKFLASPARAFKTGTEGITTKEGNTRIPADQFTGGDLAAIALGLPDLKVSKYYEYNAAFEDSKAAAAQKVAMLKHAWVRGDAEEKAKVQKQIDEFNDRHETDQIKQKDLFAAQRQDAAYHKKVTPEGLMVSKKTREFAEGIRF